MRKILEDFYFGNITPSEGDVVTNSSLRSAMVDVAQCESQLMERLDENEQMILTKLIQS